jgi:hypothetical protein
MAPKSYILRQAPPQFGPFWKILGQKKSGNTAQMSSSTENVRLPLTFSEAKFTASHSMHFYKKNQAYTFIL